MDHTDPATSAPLSTLACAIRRAVVEAGEAAYEDAGIQGLCAEGRWEAAVKSMRGVDVDAVVRRAASPGPHPSAS